MAETSRTSKRNSDPGGTHSGGRHSHHVCDRCREKKLKCDEGRPQCTQCTLHEAECHYSNKRDKRTAISKDEANRMSREIESLQERNKDLLAENDALRARLSGVHIGDDNTGTIRIERPRSLHIERPRSLHIDIPGDAAAADGNGPPSSLGTTPITVSPYSSGLSASASPYSSKRNSQTFMSSFASSRPELISGDSGEGTYATPYSPFAMASGPSTPCSATSSRRLSRSLASASASPMPGAVSLRPDRNDTIRPTEEQYHDNNCPCFWNAFIPQNLRALLARELHDLLLLELLFQRSAWHLRVIPRLFLRDMRTFLNGDHRDFTRLVGLHYSPSLHCALLAEALQLAPPGSPLLHRSNRDALIQAADELAKLQVTQNVGVASATQAMASIAQYELAHGLTRQGYLRIRNAIEVARLSGFHHEFVSDGLPSEDGDPLRKLCYLSLLVQDTDVATHTGQDVCPYEPPPPTTYLFLSRQLPQDIQLDSETFVQTAKLMTIISAMTNKFATESYLQASIVTALENQLYDWHRRIPVSHASDTSLSPPILLMHMSYYWATMSLYRPFYGREDAREGWRKYSDEACKRFFGTLRHYERNITFKHAPLSLVNMVVTAGAIALVSASLARPAQIMLRERAVAYVQMAADDLLQMGTVWPCATQYSQTLRSHLIALNAPTIPVPAPRRRRSQSLSEHRMPRPDPNAVLRGRTSDRRGTHTKNIASLSPMRQEHTETTPAVVSAQLTATPSQPAYTLENMHAASFPASPVVPANGTANFAQPAPASFAAQPTATPNGWAIPPPAPILQHQPQVLSNGNMSAQHPTIPELDMPFMNDPQLQVFLPQPAFAPDADMMSMEMFSGVPPPSGVDPMQLPFAMPHVDINNPLNLQYDPALFVQSPHMQHQSASAPEQNVWDPYMMQ